MDKDLEKLKQVINHQDNNINHLKSIHTYIELFYNKWKDRAIPYVDDITNIHFNLIEKVTK